MSLPSEKIIDGVKYTFCKRGAIEAIVLKGILFKQFGPALPKLMQAVSGAGTNTSGDIMKSLGDLNLEELMGAICSHFDPEALPGFIKLVLKNVIAEGHGRIVNKIDVAIPEWTTLVKVVIETLTVEYGSFLAEKPGSSEDALLGTTPE